MGVLPSAGGRPSDLESNDRYRRQMKVFAAVPDLFTVAEVARCLRKSPTTIRKDLAALKVEAEASRRFA